MQEHHSAHRFETGDEVQMLSDRSLIGTVVRGLDRQAGTFWYRIKLPDGRYKTVPETDIVRYQAARSPGDLLVASAFGDRDDFRRTITFHKLDEPLENTLYALNGSRTEFYPHQYRPLVKFLGSRGQRLLIADEVGLGKTIEAGLIMVEQRARGALRRVMVVCPASLRLKWQEEMWKRFDEEFHILAASDLRRRIRELRERGDLGRSREIISLESLRMQEHLEMLEATPLTLDLLIIDEAHHLRNHTTLSHRTCLALADNASAVLLLTATPIHLGTENLFNLFRVLDPAEFDDYSVFQDRLRANEPVVEAQRLVRKTPLPLGRIQERVDRMGKGPGRVFFENNPIYERVRSRAKGSGYDGQPSAAELQQDLEELNLLSHVFSRTKKRDVFHNAPERSPAVIRVEFTKEEMEFYDAVTAFVRQTSKSQHGTIRFFATMGAQRQVASSLQAARPKFTEKALILSEDPEEDDVDFFRDVDSGSNEVELSDSVIDAAENLGNVDTKYDKLVDRLNSLEREEPGRKILLFAYYKPTLNYLYRRLREDGYNCELIHGDIRSTPSRPEEDERTKRMRRFRDDASVQILLSSEVGSEGLDFQFCHILVNYDLPWNPMRIEQRIGRLDRLGQDSDRIIILNFSVRDTIEDRVLHRLYERIGIFETSIGDLDAILGDEVEELQKDLLSRDLTPQEEERRIEQAVRVIERRKKDLERLEAESSRFVGLDGYFRDQLRRLRKGGGLLSPEDMKIFFAEFLDRSCSRAELIETAPSVYRLKMSDGLRSAVRGLPDGAPKMQFLRRVKDEKVLVTFDARIAYRDDQLEFLGTHHPLFRLAIDHFRSNPDSLHPVAALRLEKSPRVPDGHYFYFVFGVDIDSGRRRRRLDSLFLRLTDREKTEVVSERIEALLLGDMLRAAVPWETPLSLGEERSREFLDRADRVFLARLARRRQEAEERNAALVQTRLTSLEESYRVRLERKEEQLRKAKSERKDERYIRLLQSTIRNMKSDYEARRDEIESEREVRFSYELVACGLLGVG